MPGYNVLMMLASSLVATTGALASYVSNSETVYVKGYSIAQPTVVRCFDTGKTCSDIGSTPCQIRILVEIGGDVVTSDPSLPFKPYRDIHDCGSILVFGGEPQISDLSINRLAVD
jgi:hypothetical protein